MAATGLVATVGLNPLAVLTAISTFTEGDIVLIGTGGSLAMLGANADSTRSRRELLARLTAGRDVRTVPTGGTTYKETHDALRLASDPFGARHLTYAGGTAGMAAASLRLWSEVNQGNDEIDAWYLDFSGTFRGTTASCQAVPPPIEGVKELIDLHAGDVGNQDGGRRVRAIIAKKPPDALSDEQLAALRRAITDDEWTSEATARDVLLGLFVAYHDGPALRRVDGDLLCWVDKESRNLRVVAASPWKLVKNDKGKWESNLGKAKEWMLYAYERAVLYGGAHARLTFLYPGRPAQGDAPSDRERLHRDVADLTAHSQNVHRVEVRDRAFISRIVDGL